MDGNDMASVEKNLFRIVEYNSQAQYPICMVEGENCKETKIATAIVVLPATIELWQLVNLTNATIEEADALSKKIADAEALRVEAEKKRESAEETRNKKVEDAISNINKAQANNIKKIEQTTTSIESGGINVITITTGNGTTSFEVRNGSKGDQGEKGEKGEKGEQGTQGIQGAKGDTGSQGERGLQGERGIQGERGEKGDMGSIGKVSISVDNTTGTPSATATASKAADGSTDISFSFKGIKGEKGEKGERGEQGLQGERGEQGLPGNDGAKGDKGDAFKYTDFTPEQLKSLTGPKGEQGDIGLTGPQGETGPVGPQGVKGDPFTYNDFTEAEIKELQKPATEAATKAQEILKKAETATAGAEKVDATLANDVLTVTNRNGESTSLQLASYAEVGDVVSEVKRLSEYHKSYIDLVFYDVWDKLVVDGETITVIKGEKMRLYPTNSFSLGNRYSRDVCPLAFADVSHLDTSRFATFAYMFQNCRNADIIGLENFDTGSVMNMSNMFSGCSSLTTLNVASFNAKKLKTENLLISGIGLMFYDCGRLKTLDMGGDDWCFDSMVENTKNFYRWLEGKNVSSLTLGKNWFKAEFTPVDFGGLFTWNKESVRLSLVTNSYDRKANGLTDKTITLHANVKKLLSEDDIAAMTAKGYIIA